MTTMRGLDQADVRVMPFNIEAEQALLGAVLLNNRLFRKVERLVTTEAFFEDLHRRIWTVIVGLMNKGQAATPITLKTYLGDQDLGGVTVSQYLARLAAEATGSSTAEDYARVVASLATRRRIIAIADTVMATAYDMPVETTAETVLNEFSSQMEELRLARGDDADFQTFDASAAVAYQMAEAAYQRGRSIVGVSTGLPRLDDALGGMQPSDLIILAGRPGMGKTALATNIAFNAALSFAERRAGGEKTGVVGFSSLEMSAAQLCQRIMSEQSGVSNWRIRRGEASAEEMERFYMAGRDLAGLPLEIDQTGGLNIASLRMRARDLKKRKGLELLVVDYLQLLVGLGTKRDNRRVDDVTEITAGLKGLAKELEIPVLALSQLSRKVEERDDKRPQLSDLRESGSIEQDADVVMFVFREDYYLRKAQPPVDRKEAHEDWEKRLRAVTGVAQILIGKNRHGPEGTVVLGFEANTTKFVNEPPAREEEPERSPGPTRKKKVNLPAEASVLYGILRSMSHTARVPTPEERAINRDLHKLARLVPVAAARDKFGADAMGPDSADLPRVRKRFTDAVKPLLKNDLARYVGREDDWFLWLPELAREE